MSVRDPLDKQRRLLDAALLSFAQRGLAGARVDEIANRARCSPGLLYSYFGSKEGLFDAVLDDLAARTSSEVPFNAADLPGYAESLHRDAVQHPEVGRFAAWHGLERSRSVTAKRGPLTEATMGKITAIEAAQDQALVPSRLSAAETLLAVQAIARMWINMPDEVTAVVDPSRDEVSRAAAVRRAVAALLQ